MGIFSSKKKHIVEATVIRVIEDDVMPNVLVKAVGESVFRNQRLPPTLLASVLTSSWTRFERAYRYAERGDYYYGLPNATVKNNASFASAPFVAAIKNSGAIPTEDTVSISYIRYAPLNNFFMAWKRLYEVMDYNPSSNKLTYNGNSEVYLEGIRARHLSSADLPVDAAALGSWENPSTQGDVPGEVWIERSADLAYWEPQERALVADYGSEGYYIDLAWEDTANNNALVRKSLFFNLNLYDTDKEYYHVKYQLNDKSVGKVYTRFWVYDPLTKRYPNIDNLLGTTAYTNPGTYFPFVIFRSEGQDKTDPALHGTDAYKSSVELCKRIGFDYQELSDQIHENENVKDIRQAVMMLGVPITTQDPIQCEYLYEFFKRLEEQVGFQPTETVDTLNSGSAAPPRSHVLEVADADFVMRISFDGVKQRSRFGNIGPVGTYKNIEEKVEVDQQVTGNLVITMQSPGLVRTTKNRIIQRQVTENLIEEVRIENPQFRFEIFKDKGAEGGFDDDRMLIPLDYEITKSFSLVKKEDLYCRSLQLVFNSHIIQRTPWYARGAFKAIVIIIAVVIALYDGGFTLQGVLAALAAGGTSALVMTLIIVGTIVKVLVVSAIVNLIIKEAVNTLGPEWGAILAAAAVMYGVYGEVTGTALYASITPVEMIAIAGNIYSNVQRLELEAIQAKFDDFLEYQEEQYELLEQAQDLLGDPLNLDPLLFVYREPIFVPGETPDQFYARTVEFTNPGTYSLDFIQNFYAASLSLPGVE